MRLIPLLLAATLAALPARAAEDVLDKTSPHDVATTIDRLEQAVKDAGASVVARVDHSGVAKGAGMELRPTQVLIFGNPKMGTPLMQESQSIGLDLPLRVVAYEDAEGTVHLAYPDIGRMAEEHGLAPDHAAVAKVRGALEKLTDQAIAEQ